MGHLLIYNKKFDLSKFIRLDLQLIVVNLKTSTTIFIVFLRLKELDF